MKTILPLKNNVNDESAIPNASKLKGALLGVVMCSVCVVTQAADGNAHQSYSIKVVKKHVDAKASVSKPSLSKNTETSASKADASIVTVSKQNLSKLDVSKDKRTVRLEEGGVIWVSNDPVALTPLLDVTTNKSIKINGKRFDSPTSFTLNTNYAAFIDSWELAVYRASDIDESRVLKRFEGKTFINGHKVQWDGDIISGERLSPGDKLKYVLTVKNKAGHSDVTYPREILLQGPGRNLDLDTIEEATAQNNLERQTIPLYGSRVRIYGNDIEEGNTVSVDGEKASVVNRRFVIEKLLPEGKHDFAINITENNKNYTKQISTLVDGRYMFMVGLADLTIGEGSVSDNLETLSDGDKYLDGDIFVDGRVAFYLKGKVKGKYLVTAQMDTGTAEIDELFDDIHKKDAQSVFRRLDPDKYYPVYGDDSSVIDDTNSQGKVYVRVDWDKSRGIWGNFNTDMTGTELSSFNRSLYGAKLNHKSINVTKSGDHKTDLTVFASEAQSAYGHNEFLGTGGSLYYLKDTDLVDGSEKVWVEVRDTNSSRVIETVVMEEGRDYQIDDFQGRIILNRPLLQIAEQAYPSLVKDNPLDGDQVYLMVDYEYVPDDFNSDKASYGARGKVWLNDHFAVGGSYAHENRNEDDYDLKGVDITLKKSKGTFLVAEYAETESLQTANSFTSLDGGINFGSLIDDDLSDKKGEAYSLEARVNFEDYSNKTGAAAAWYKNRDAGFSSTRAEQGVETIDVGLEANLEVNEKFKFSTRITELEKRDESKISTASLQGDFSFNDRLTLSAEARYIREEDLTTAGSATDGEGTLAAFKVGYDVNENVNLYVIGQSTLDKSGAYTSNDLVTLGTKARINKRISLNGEVSSGDRGEAATIGLDYKLNDRHSVYTNYTHSTDTTFDKRHLFTVGQRRNISNRLNVFTEHQFTHESDQSGLGHTFGLDYKFSKQVTLSSSVQTVSLDKDDGSGITDRDAFSVGLNYEHGKSTGSTRLEYRRDKNDSSSSPENTEQWVSTNRINYRLNPSFRIQGQLNYSVTQDKESGNNDARFIEAGIGFAYRPVNHSRLNVLGRLNYLYDLQPESQSSENDERSYIASVEGTYQLNRRWKLGGKLAHKQSEIRSDRDTGTWTDNDATLAAARLSYHMSKNWDASAQYHWLNSDASEDNQHGALLSIDRHIGKNMKIGIGYNFTRFNDDLSDTNGDAKGWFVNLVGKF